MNGTDKVFGKNLTSVTHESPIQASSENISYIGKVVLQFKKLILLNKINK